MFSFSTDYFLFVFVSGIGAIQVAASLGDLKGLLLLQSKTLTRALGLALPVAAAVWFFSTEARNINDYEEGLDANSQALFFFFGAFSAVIATFVVASIVNYRMAGSTAPRDAGLDAVRDTNYAKALARSLSYWWKNWRKQTKDYFSG